jgi:hypothetical protein
VAGTTVYLGTAGALTSTKPSFPAGIVSIGTVVVSDAVEGSIYVQPQRFQDGRTSGQFTWGAGGATSGTVTVSGLTSTSCVIIQERGSAAPVGSFYSVQCSTGSFVVRARVDSGTSTTGTLPLTTTVFSYIAFI